MKARGSHIFILTLAFGGLALLLGPALADSPGAGTRAGRRSTFSYDPHLIRFARGPVDTRQLAGEDSRREDARAARAGGLSLRAAARKQLRVVQFNGPTRRAWLERLRAEGAEIVGYIPNHAYLIRGDALSLSRVALRAGAKMAEDLPVRWMGRYRNDFKFAPLFAGAALPQAGAPVDVEIELLDVPEAEEAVAYIEQVAVAVNRAPRAYLKYRLLSVAVPADRLPDIAAFEEVLFISPASTPELHDEMSAQIVAGNLTPDRTQPAGPGYRDWLAGLGLNGEADFVIDFTDTGLDMGSTAAGLVHPDFRDDAGESRVAYNTNYTTDGQADDRRGHGTLMASVAAGSGASDSGNQPAKDAAGYLYGLGVDPFARIGASRIFSATGRLPFQLQFTTVAAAAYAGGARISNNSWGNGVNVYDATAREYDALVRDAQPGVAGNQEMTFVCSAGNNGAGGRISSPGTAKNVITVAASENFRPQGSDSCNLDGLGAIGPEGADNALDILRYSSGGPTNDLRAKPDITAPGTHIFGAASRAPMFNGDGLCPGLTLFQPPGQRLFTWSSGTSLAAPHVSGAASLLRRFLAQGLIDNAFEPDGEGRKPFTARAPSPAMTKAFLVNAAAYLTGENAGGDLPSPRQGFGLLALDRAFDDTARLLVDQMHRFSESGESFTVRGAIADRSRPLRVTLAWTDAPGTPGGAATVNDLDLEITVGGVTVYRGNNFAEESAVPDGEADRFNNLESIFLPADMIPEGAAGNLTITVRAANIAGDGVPGNGDPLDQDFALVVYNFGEAVEEPPPPVKPTISGATYIKKILTITGQNFTAAARVEINGQIVPHTFTFDAASRTLSLKKKRKKLKLVFGDNTLVLIENGQRSEAFTLRL